MKVRLPYIVAALLAVAFSNPAIGGDNPNPYCHNLGGFKEPVCMPSMSVLMARREEFDNKLVIVTGYFVYGGVSMLFANVDSYMNSDTSNGLVVSPPKDHALEQKLFIGFNHRYVRILGRFKARPVELFEYGAYFSGGALKDITEVDEAVNPWGGYASPPPDSRQK